MSQKTRSTLSVDAVAQAAAEGAVSALSPTGKIRAIAALAGFVLRLFRSKERLQDGPTKAPRRINEGNTKEKRGKNGSGALPARRGLALAPKGGIRHG